MGGAKKFDHRFRGEVGVGRGDSGGGVYIWNTETSRLELVGINESGTEMGSDWVVFRVIDERMSNYIPIGVILRGVQEAADEMKLQEQ